MDDPPCKPLGACKRERERQVSLFTVKRGEGHEHEPVSRVRDRSTRAGPGYSMCSGNLGIGSEWGTDRPLSTEYVISRNGGTLSGKRRVITYHIRWPRRLPAETAVAISPRRDSSS